MTTCPLNHPDCSLTPKPDPKPKPPGPAYFDIVAATLNVQRTLTTERALADMYEVINWPTSPHIIVMQEVQARDSIFHSFNKKSRYWAVHHMGYEHAIMWRKDILRSGEWDAVKMHAGKAKVSPTRYTAWNDFEIIPFDDYQFTAASKHCVSGVERGGRPRLTRPWQVGAMKEDMVRTEAWVEAKAKTRPVIVGGDLNVDYRKDRIHQSTYFPYASYKRAGLIPSYLALGMPKGGTHGNRLIDWWAHAPGRAKMEAVSHGIMRDFYTDHHGLLVRYRFHR